MNLIDIITIAVIAGLAVLGAIAGFGKSLKRFTGGIVGIIISVFVCTAIGGMVLSIGPVAELVNNVNTALAEKAAFLGKIHAGVIIYYIVLFLVVQVLRIIIVKVICKIFESDNKPMKVINAVLGLVFVPAVTLLFVLLLFAVVKNFENTAFIRDIMAKIENTILLKLYNLNPIVLKP